MEELNEMSLFMSLDDSVLISLNQQGNLEELCMSLCIELHSKPQINFMC